MIRYQPLLVCTFTHQYLNDESLPFLASARRETIRVANRCGCMVKVADGAILFLAEVDGAGASSALQLLNRDEPEADLVFDVFVSDPLFHNYSLPYFTSDQAMGRSVQVQFVARPGAAGSLTYGVSFEAPDLTPGDRTPTFSLRVPIRLLDLPPPGHPIAEDAMQLEVHFSSRTSYWRYVFPWLDESDDQAWISDRAGGVQFAREDAEKHSLIPGTRFISSAPLAMTKRPAYKFDLLRGAARDDGVIISLLPYPLADQLKSYSGSSNALVSEVIVN